MINYWWSNSVQSADDSLNMFVLVHVLLRSKHHGGNVQTCTVLMTKMRYILTINYVKFMWAGPLKHNFMISSTTFLTLQNTLYMIRVK
jgi:hypothetical protein